MLSGLIAVLALNVADFKWSDVRRAPAPRGALALSSGRVLIPGRGPGPGARLVCFASDDFGQTWRTLGTIATDPDARTDIGDGNIARGHNGELFTVYRHNHHGPEFPQPDYAIKMAVSRDGGRTWTERAVVASSRPQGPGPSRGLWSPYVFVTHEGEAQCYYDDEATPFRMGYRGHQWLSMRRFDARTGAWGPVITVARAHHRAHLSRDGMASVIEVRPRRLLCAFESVQTEAPHAGLVRFVESVDGGGTWSWESRERAVLYAPKDRRYHAFSPTLAMTRAGVIALIATNEDRPEPGRSGTPPEALRLDIKSLRSRDGGRTWPTSATLVYAGSHRNYLPGLVVSRDRLMATFLDFDKGFLSATTSVTGR